MRANQWSEVSLHFSDRKSARRFFGLLLGAGLRCHHLSARDGAVVRVQYVAESTAHRLIRNSLVHDQNAVLTPSAMDFLEGYDALDRQPRQATNPAEQPRQGGSRRDTAPDSPGGCSACWRDDRLLQRAAWLIPRNSRDAILGDIVEDEHEARSRGEREWNIRCKKVWSLTNAVGQHIPNWLAWLGGVITGWLFPGTR